MAGDSLLDDCLIYLSFYGICNKMFQQPDATLVIDSSF